MDPIINQQTHQRLILIPKPHPYHATHRMRKNKFLTLTQNHPQFPWIQLKRSVSAVTNLVLSGYILGCSIEVAIVGYGVESRHVDQTLKKLVDGLSSLLCFYAFLGVEHREEQTLFVVVLFPGRNERIKQLRIFPESIQLLPQLPSIYLIVPHIPLPQLNLLLLFLRSPDHSITLHSHTLLFLSL